MLIFSIYPKRFHLLLQKLMLLLALGGAVMLAAPIAQASPSIRFELVTHYRMEGNAEIIQAFADGQFLVHTNSDLNSIDVVDIRNPQAPAFVASLSMPGEPTSVGVSPDGYWAMAVVYAAKSKAKRKPKDPRLPGVLALLDLRDPMQPHIAALLGIGHHPDSIAVTERGGYLYGIVAVENEPLIVVDGRVVGSDLPGQQGDISEAGSVQVVKIDTQNPSEYSVKTIALPAALLEKNGLLLANDPQPEYIAIPKSGSDPAAGLAAVALQENNGILLIDPFSGAIQRIFTLGAVATRPADLADDGVIRFDHHYPDDALDNEPLAGARCPDAISFTPGGDYLLSADEGELDLTGGRGFSVWSLAGEFVWDDAGEIERKAAALGLYPDKRSDDRGIEIEGITAASFNGHDYAFALSERGSFVAIYDISDPRAPTFEQIIATEIGPESAIAIPARGLLAVAAETGKAITLLQVATEP